MKRSKPETHRPTGIRFSAQLVGLTPTNSAGQQSRHIATAYNRGAGRYHVRLQGLVNEPLTYPQSTEGDPRGSEWIAEFEVRPCRRLRDAGSSGWDLRPTTKPLPGGASGPMIVTRAWVVGEHGQAGFVAYDAGAVAVPVVKLEDVLD